MNAGRQNNITEGKDNSTVKAFVEELEKKIGKRKKI
jgi:hypothetical protein